MSEKITGKIFIFSKERTEKTISMLESKVSGMSTVAFNSIMPIVPFPRSWFPYRTIKSLFQLGSFIAITHIIIGIEWLINRFEKDKKTFQKLFISKVGIQELKFESEHEGSELEYNCLCTYVKFKGRLIGVIHYGYEKQEKQKK